MLVNNVSTKIWSPEAVIYQKHTQL
jgi:hypothetical protein